MRRNTPPLKLASRSSEKRRALAGKVAVLGAAIVLGGILVMELAGQNQPSAVAQYQYSWSQFDSPAPPPVTKALLTKGEGLYALNCAVCHGETGQGNGWRAAFLYPKPRDFTRGIYRFKTTESGSLPTDSDLFRTISTGLQGTAMPAWRYYLTENDRWALAAYIKTFSRYFREEPAGQAIRLGPAPELTTERITRGRDLYAKVGCADCHGPQGYGDGFAAKGMEDSFGVPIAPRNFHYPGEFKRGRTLTDVAMTIHTGNDGSPMPSFHRSLTSEQVWDLASFVISLPVETPTFRGPGCPMMVRMQQGVQ